MKRVPNIVFLIIAIIGLAAAGIMFSMYSSEKEMSSNSLNKIAELEKDVDKLMNKNSDLMMQMSGVEDQKKKLEDKAKEQIISEGECMLIIDDLPVGITKIKGYYGKAERFGEAEEGVECDIFTVTEASETFSNYLKAMADSMNPLIFRTQDGFSINISQYGVINDDWDKVINSHSDQPVEMMVFKKRMRTNYGPHPCESIIDIVKIN
jgi:hypothetical protein